LNHDDFRSIDKETAGYALTTAEKEWLDQNREETVEFLLRQLARKKQPRDDYRELIQLCLLNLGETDPSPGRVRFNIPGAYHRARWMAKGIYCLKILAFRTQFKLTSHELQALKRICIFTVTLYVKAWFQAPVSCDAPLNDLCFLQKMESFINVDKRVAETALSKMRGHLWYLSEDLAGLALFSCNVQLEEKKAIITAMQKPSNETHQRRVQSQTITSFQATTLSDYVTSQSLRILTILKLSDNFIHFPPEEWIGRDDYRRAKEIVCALRVVNDCAERAVKLATDFNLELTHNEEQRQLIFQIVEHHRKNLPNATKKAFLNI
jgi:hypothetical protein